MKTRLLIFATLAVGTAAIAQNTPAGSPAQGSPPDTNTPAPATPDASAPAPATDATTAAPMAPSSGTTAPAQPMGSDTSGATGMPATTDTDTSNYPPCSRTVHDKCVQTHEMARTRHPH